MEKMSIQSIEIRGKLVVKTATWEGFTIQLVRPQTAPESAEFRPGRVVSNNVECWNFKADHFDYRGSATLVECDEELIVCLVSKGYLDQVLPILDLPSYQKTANGERLGGRSLKKLIELKEVIASELGLEPLWSVRETQMRQAIRDANKSERDTQEAAAKKMEEDRKRIRNEERAKILRRKRQYAFTATGERRNGIPVVGNEWEMLPADTFCILVESWNDETSGAGTFAESFVVSKKGTKKIRSAVVAVMRDNPQQQLATTTPLKVEPIIVTIKGMPEEVIPVLNMDAVHELNNRGLNSGTLVMCPKKDDADAHEVFKLMNGKIISVTTLRRRRVA